MALTPITDQADSRRAFGLLARRLKAHAESKRRLIGWQGGCDEFTIYWHPREGIWALPDSEYGGTRYWCPYGTIDPKTGNNLPITCEINPPYRGFDRRCAGVFVKDENGRVYLAHSGKIGGGRKGIGKSRFLDSHRGDDLSAVSWPDGIQSDVVVIGALADQHLISHIARFVREVENFKKAVTSGTLPASNPTETVIFTPEFSGPRSPYSVKGPVESSCYHGHVVEGLATEVEKLGYTFGNDQRRDLFLARGRGNVTVLFEVKTDTSNASIYGAVGQLMLHGALQPRQPERILVVPGKPGPKFQGALAMLGIRVLSYRWDGDRPVFTNLREVLDV